MRREAKYRKFVCAECGKPTMLPLRAFDRRTRPRCSMCGSYALDPCDNAVETLAAGHDARKEAEVKDPPRVA